MERIAGGTRPRGCAAFPAADAMRAPARSLVRAAIHAWAGAALLVSGAALAQSSNTGGGAKPAEIRQPNPPQITQPGGPQDGFVKSGGAANAGPGSVGTQVRGGGTGAASRSNNSGAAGNAERPEMPVPNTGGGGSGGGGN